MRDDKNDKFEKKSNWSDLYESFRRKPGWRFTGGCSTGSIPASWDPGGWAPIDDFRQNMLLLCKI